jgi:hypothetical protein
MTHQLHGSDAHGRKVFSVASDTLEGVAAELRGVDDHFILVLAADTTGQSSTDLFASAEALIRRGASYVCCWGPGCERLHDCFDEADVALHGGETERRLVMTTWHADESLGEVLWFALNAAVPAPAYQADTRSVVAAAVARSDWADSLREYLGRVPPPDEA